MIPIRVWLADNTTQYRMVRDLEHSTLCKAFNLDPFVVFDLPSTARGVGSSTQGYNTNFNNSKNRIIEGYILRNGEPIGRMWIAQSGDQFRDLDVTNINEMMNLQHIKR